MFLPAIARIVALVAFLATAVVGLDWSKEQILVMYDSALLEDPLVLDQYFSLDTTSEITYVDYSESNRILFLNNEPLFSHAVFLPHSKKAVGAKSIVDRHILLEFINLGGNIIAVGSAEHAVPEEVRLILNQAGIHPAPKGYAVADHFDASVSIGNDNLVSTSIISSLPAIKYDGSAALLSNSELLIPLVKAPKLSFTSSPKDKVLLADKTWTVGEQGFLGVAYQGLNNARGVWLGSIDLLSKELVSWVFHKSGVLKLQFVEHYKSDEPGLANRTLYRISDSVYYSLGVSELKDGAWVPYTPALDENVLQMSFKMLDPYQRLNMTLLGPGASTENGPNDMNIFAVEFQIPDHHGMFTFEFDYKREGLTFLLDKRVVTVRHLANDEYKRSWDITNAWMYVVSAGVVVLAWLVFVMNFLYLGGAAVKQTPASKTQVEKAEKATEKATEKTEAEKTKTEKATEKATKKTKAAKANIEEKAEEKTAKSSSKNENKK